ncbi:MAG: fibrobacter succinogenes major paralogous domain-containing protein [Bacteroidales bacterium]|nr:fibrobacter succinogenes major paralogous domain-containing protein [Bacteroidales bacterium]
MGKLPVTVLLTLLPILLFSQNNNHKFISQDEKELNSTQILNKTREKNNYSNISNQRTNKPSNNEYDTIIDIDKNKYKTVQIGNQLWMAENLKVIHYQDGSEINLVTDNKIWANLKAGAYCWYNNDSIHKNLYGAIYNFYAICNLHNLCPMGWHVPTDTEWEIAVNFLGGKNIAGGKLKEIGLLHWKNPNICANNSTGFTALPGGYRIGNSGSFYDFGSVGFWWSSTEYNSEYAYLRYINNNNSSLKKNFYVKRFGFSVRCIKDN